jgi:phosphoribosylformylglycinamidine synthase
VQKAVSEIIKSDLVASANDCSDGGLFIAVLESAMASDLSFHINTNSAIRKDAFLFGEAQSRVIISIDPSQKNALETTLKKLKVPFSEIGKVAQKEVKIDKVSYGNCHEFKRYYEGAITNILSEK